MYRFENIQALPGNLRAGPVAADHCDFHGFHRRVMIWQSQDCTGRDRGTVGLWDCGNCCHPRVIPRSAEESGLHQRQHRVARKLA
jgi:hypothetical protein